MGDKKLVCYMRLSLIYSLWNFYEYAWRHILFVEDRYCFYYAMSIERNLTCLNVAAKTLSKWIDEGGSVREERERLEVANCCLERFERIVYQLILQKPNIWLIQIGAEKGEWIMNDERTSYKGALCCYISAIFSEDNKVFQWKFFVHLIGFSLK